MEDRAATVRVSDRDDPTSEGRATSRLALAAVGGGSHHDRSVVASRGLGTCVFFIYTDTISTPSLAPCTDYTCTDDNTRGGACAWSAGRHRQKTIDRRCGNCGALRTGTTYKTTRYVHISATRPSRTQMRGFGDARFISNLVAVVGARRARSNRRASWGTSCTTQQMALLAGGYKSWMESHMSV